MCESYDLKQKRNKTWHNACPHRANTLLAESQIRKLIITLRVIVPRVCAKSLKSCPTSVMSHLGHVWLFVTLQTVACQAPLSVGFPRQEYWSGLPCPPPWFSHQGSNPCLLCLLHWQVGSSLVPPGKPYAKSQKSLDEGIRFYLIKINTFFREKQPLGSWRTCLCRSGMSEGR